MRTRDLIILVQAAVAGHVVVVALAVLMHSWLNAAYYTVMLLLWAGLWRYLEAA